MLRLIIAVLPGLIFAQDFSGTWLLESGGGPSRLTISTTPQGKLSCAECGPGGWLFAPDRRTHESTGGGVRHSIVGKWEGSSAMMLNVMVSQGGAQWTIMDHWRLSRDGSTLTIHRETQRGGRTADATYIYQKQGFRPPVNQPTLAEAVPPPAVPQRPEPTAPPVEMPKAEPETVRLEKGARLPLRSLSSFSSKTANEGDRVYLEVAQPVARFGRVVLPVGSQVSASVAFVKPSGKVKGRGELMLRFESVTLPNGVTRDFRAATTGADAGAGQVDSEGRIKAPGDKSGDAGKVAKTTAIGTVIGASVGQGAGSTALGAGIGAAAGAAAGLGRVLGSKGPDVQIRRGDIIEMSLDRDLLFSEDDLRR